MEISDRLSGKEKESSIIAKTKEDINKLENQGNVYGLILALKNKDPYLREKAAEALCNVGNSQAVKSLVDVLEDERPKVRMRAVEALDHIGWKPEENKLGAQYWTVKYLHPESEKIQQAAAKALNRVSWQPDQSEAGATYWIVKRQWDKCVEIGVPAVKPLFVMLQDADTNVREAAAGALVQIGQPAVEFLVSALEDYFLWCYTDNSSLVLRITAANVLGKIGDPRAIEILINMGSKRQFTSDPRRAVPGRVWVSGTDKKRETWDHRYAAADALARIGEPSIEPLIATLKKEMADFRQLAALALGKIGDPRAVEPLISVLSSPYHDRIAALRALRTITGKDFGEDVHRWQEYSKGFAPGGGPHTEKVNALAVTPDGRWAVSVSKDKTIKVWDIESGKLVITHTGQTREVNAVAVTPDGKKILLGTQGEDIKIAPFEYVMIDSRIILLDLHSGEEIMSFRHDGGVFAVAITPDGRRVISGSGNSDVKVWNLDSGKEEITFDKYKKSGERRLYSLAITPDGQRVVSVSGFEKIYLLNLETGEEECTYGGHEDTILKVAITLDGKRVISGSRDNKLKVWDLSSGEELVAFSGPDEAVNAVAVTLDGQFAISAYSDKTLKIWDLTRKCEIHTLKGHTDKVSAVAITPDNKYILSASAEGILKMWSFDDGKEIRTMTGKQIDTQSDQTAQSQTPVSQTTHSGAPDAPGDDDEETRVETVFELRRDLKKRGSVRKLIAFTSDSSARVRALAAQSLGKSGDTSSVPALVKLLSDPVDEVVVEVVESLGRLRDERALEHLQLLEEKANDRIAKACNKAARRIRDDDERRLQAH